MEEDERRPVGAAALGGLGGFGGFGELGGLGGLEPGLDGTAADIDHGCHGGAVPELVARRSRSA